MNERAPCGVSVISFPIAQPSIFQYLIYQIYCQLSVKHMWLSAHVFTPIFKNRTVQCTYPLYPINLDRRVIFKQVLRYIVLQVKIISKLILLRENFRSVIFFMEFPPILPMAVAKIFSNKVLVITLKFHFCQIVHHQN